MTAVDPGAISARTGDKVSFGMVGFYNVCGTCGAVVAAEHVAVHAAWHDTALTETVVPDSSASV